MPMRMPMGRSRVGRADGTANIPAPPPGNGYVYYADANGFNQAVTYTGTTGATWPLTYQGGS